MAGRVQELAQRECSRYAPDEGAARFTPSLKASASVLSASGIGSLAHDETPLRRSYGFVQQLSRVEG